MTCSVQIIADSICNGHRLTTFQLNYWRALHPEVMSHRAFSRNAGSSRARPAKGMIEQVRTNPAGPIHWGLNRAGMQATEELSPGEIEAAKALWKEAANSAANHAEILADMGLHKQVVNRVLEPFQYIDVVLSATDFSNWFALRDHPDAQPEIQELARAMRKEYDSSVPRELVLGDWHLPYILEEELGKYPTTTLAMASSARCARVSYKLFDGTNTSIDKDFKLYEKLSGNKPPHLSPLEHPAQALGKGRFGNFVGFKQLRQFIEEI